MTTPADPDGGAVDEQDAPQVELADTTGVAEAPVVAGDDVRPGPEFTDEPVAGATEPSD